MSADNNDYAEDLALAHLLADIADEIALDRYQSLDLVVTLSQITLLLRMQIVR